MDNKTTGIESAVYTLRGRADSRLVVHAFSEKTRKEIADKQQKNVKKAKEARNPSAECEQAKYIDSQGRECLPIAAIKKALISAATAFADFKKCGLRQALFCSTGEGCDSMLLPIWTSAGQLAKGAMREDAVTIGINTRGLTYRPEYIDWQVHLTIEYNSRMISKKQLDALIDQAGWGVGICEGRPEKTSALGWGRFERVE